MSLNYLQTNNFITRKYKAIGDRFKEKIYKN
jgi:hypothetical protein